MALTLNTCPSCGVALQKQLQSKELELEGCYSDEVLELQRRCTELQLANDKLEQQVDRKTVELSDCAIKIRNLEEQLQSASNRATYSELTRADIDSVISHDIDHVHSQLVYKDQKIMELNNLILDRERDIMDLQEMCREQGELVQAKSRAFHIVQNKLLELSSRTTQEQSTETDTLTSIQQRLSTSSSSSSSLPASSNIGQNLLPGHAVPNLKLGYPRTSPPPLDPSEERSSLTPEIGPNLDEFDNDSSILDNLASLKKKGRKRVTFDLPPPTNLKIGMTSGNGAEDDIVQAIIDLTAENDQLRQTIREIELPASEARVRSEQLLMELEQARRDCKNQVLKARASMQSKIRDLEDKITATSIENNEKVEHLNASVEALRSDREWMLEENARMLKLMESYKEKLKDAWEAMDLRHSENETLHSKLDEDRAFVVRLADDLEEAQKTANTLLQQRILILDDVDRLKEALEAQDEYIKLLETDTIIYEEHIGLLRDSLGASKVEKRALIRSKAFEAKTKAVEQEKDQINRRKTDEKLHTKALHFKISSLEAEISVLRQRNDALEQNVSKTNKFHGEASKVQGTGSAFTPVQPSRKLMQVQNVDEIHDSSAKLLPNVSSHGLRNLQHGADDGFTVDFNRILEDNNRLQEKVMQMECANFELENELRESKELISTMQSEKEAQIANSCIKNESAAAPENNEPCECEQSDANLKIMEMEAELSAIKQQLFEKNHELLIANENRENKIGLVKQWQFAVNEMEAVHSELQNLEQQLNEEKAAMESKWAEVRSVLLEQSAENESATTTSNLQRQESIQQLSIKVSELEKMVQQQSEKIETDKMEKRKLKAALKILKSQSTPSEPSGVDKNMEVALEQIAGLKRQRDFMDQELTHMFAINAANSECIQKLRTELTEMQQKISDSGSTIDDSELSANENLVQLRECSSQTMELMSKNECVSRSVQCVTKFVDAAIQTDCQERVDKINDDDSYTSDDNTHQTSDESLAELKFALNAANETKLCIVNENTLLKSRIEELSLQLTNINCDLAKQNQANKLQSDDSFNRQEISSSPIVALIDDEKTTVTSTAMLPENQSPVQFSSELDGHSESMNHESESLLLRQCITESNRIQDDLSDDLKHLMCLNSELETAVEVLRGEVWSLHAQLKNLLTDREELENKLCEVTEQQVEERHRAQQLEHELEEQKDIAEKSQRQAALAENESNRRLVEWQEKNVEMEQSRVELENAYVQLTDYYQELQEAYNALYSKLDVSKEDKEICTDQSLPDDRQEIVSKIHRLESELQQSKIELDKRDDDLKQLKFLLNQHLNKALKCTTQIREFNVNFLKQFIQESVLDIHEYLQNASIQMRSKMQEVLAATLETRRSMSAEITNATQQLISGVFPNENEAGDTPLLMIVEAVNTHVHQLVSEMVDLKAELETEKMLKNALELQIEKTDNACSKELENKVENLEELLQSTQFLLAEHLGIAVDQSSSTTAEYNGARLNLETNAFCPHTICREMMPSVPSPTQLQLAILAARLTAKIADNDALIRCNSQLANINVQLQNELDQLQQQFLQTDSTSGGQIVNCATIESASTQTVDIEDRQEIVDASSEQSAEMDSFASFGDLTNIISATEERYEAERLSWQRLENDLNDTLGQLLDGSDSKNADGSCEDILIQCSEYADVDDSRDVGLQCENVGTGCALVQTEQKPVVSVDTITDYQWVGVLELRKQNELLKDSEAALMDTVDRYADQLADTQRECDTLREKLSECASCESRDASNQSECPNIRFAEVQTDAEAVVSVDHSVQCDIGSHSSVTEDRGQDSCHHDKREIEKLREINKTLLLEKKSISEQKDRLQKQLIVLKKGRTFSKGGDVDVRPPSVMTAQTTIYLTENATPLENATLESENCSGTAETQLSIGDTVIRTLNQLQHVCADRENGAQELHAICEQMLKTGDQIWKLLSSQAATMSNRIEQLQVDVTDQNCDSSQTQTCSDAMNQAIDKIESSISDDDDLTKRMEEMDSEQLVSVSGTSKSLNDDPPSSIDSMDREGNSSARASASRVTVLDQQSIQYIGTSVMQILRNMRNECTQNTIANDDQRRELFAEFLSSLRHFADEHVDSNRIDMESTQHSAPRTPTINRRMRNAMDDDDSNHWRTTIGAQGDAESAITRNRSDQFNQQQQILPEATTHHLTGWLLANEKQSDGHPFQDIEERSCIHQSASVVTDAELVSEVDSNITNEKIIISQLQSDNVRLEEELFYAHNKIEEINSEIMKRTRFQQNLECDLRDAKLHICNLNRELTRLKIAISAIESENTAIDFVKYNERMTEMQQSHMETLGQLKDELRISEAKLMIAEDNERMGRNHIDQLKLHVSDWRSRFEELSRENETLQRMNDEVHNLETTIKEISQDKERIACRLCQVMEECKQLTSSRNHLSGLLNQAQSQIDTYQTKLQSASEARTQNAVKIIEMESEINELKAELTKIKSILADVEAENIEAKLLLLSNANKDSNASTIVNLGNYSSGTQEESGSLKDTAHSESAEILHKPVSSTSGQRRNSSFVAEDVKLEVDPVQIDSQMSEAMIAATHPWPTFLDRLNRHIRTLPHRRGSLRLYLRYALIIYFIVLHAILFRCSLIFT